MFTPHVCYCIKGHKKTFRIFGNIRSKIFFNYTHRHRKFDI